MNPRNQALESAPALAGPTPDRLSAALQARRSPRRWASVDERLNELSGES